MPDDDKDGLIDPPFGGGLEAWLRFKVEMQRLPQTSDVQDFIDEANREIKALEHGRPRWQRPPKQPVGT